MLKEEKIQSLRGKGIVPEYSENIFPPNVGGIYDNELVTLIGEANRAIGNLNSYAKIVPNPDLLIGPMLLREALASSKIEGTLATARDIVEHDAGIKLSSQITGEVLEVINHREASRLGLELITKGGLPIVNRVIKPMHERLMHKVRGKELRLGCFREGSNAIIATKGDLEEILYLPPVANKLESLMSRLEEYLNKRNPEIDTILRCAISHYEFEAIHPFADGNGRLGRVLISLFLIEQKVLEYPLLYMSGYLLRERSLYYKTLLDVTKNEDWKSWLKFFLRGVKEQATKSRAILERIYGLYKADKKVVDENIKSIYALRLLEQIFISPVVTAAMISKSISCEHSIAMTILKKMAKLEILKEDKEKKRNVPFYNDKLISLLDET